MRERRVSLKGKARRRAFQQTLLVGILFKLLATRIVQYFIVALLLSFEYRNNIPPTRGVKLSFTVFTENNDSGFNNFGKGFAYILIPVKDLVAT